MKTSDNIKQTISKAYFASTIGIFLIVCSLLTTFKTKAQDLHFSQFWMTPVLQNPSLVGIGHDMQAIINYKDQWRSIASPYKTFDVSFDMKLNKKKAVKGFWAAGINIFSDKAGDAQMGTTLGDLNIAYHIKVNAKSTLGGGLMAGFGQRSINYSKLEWSSQYDGTAYNSSLQTGEQLNTTKYTYADVGAGLVWAYKKGEAYIAGNDQMNANAGIAVFHLNQPKYSFLKSKEKLYMKTIIHANVLYGIKNTNLSIVPGFVVNLQGTANEITVGTMLRYTTKESSKYTSYAKGSAISLGLHYRNKDALITSFLLEMGSYAVGLSYDANISGLKKVSTGKGGLEISLRFVNPNPFINSSRSRI